MTSISLTVWVGIIAFLIGVAGTVILLSPKTSQFGLARKTAGFVAAAIAIAIVFLPVLFIPSLGAAGILLSVAAVIILAISAWKWWALWIPIP